MKKSVIYLGVALLAFANVSVASNGNVETRNNVEVAAFGKTPLTVAVGKGDIEIVRKFIEYGADVNQKSEDDMTPLMIAARYNRVEIMKLLIANGARTYEKNEKGYTALKYAQLSNATEAIAILKDAK
ncbi:ankyrin repeat domain-containing protein [Flavobacterium quisquiliarum]|uniref:Ankyrin repeat domain-containing protein n=1 Tax=Flavobacterium quisquiliarum TaxID=1834436 RepID=A0ABV8W342_9FLAO|nr:ankyrin repeat domain-containing protein [Flavobacterium quisquiliarum]MBW1654346.1 ankyrin repeat domain-containing protein [Flavobacterium quisquiliarum]NWL03389.1 ankyrin repeat domain-containing protein [Flavobacterium collinsii]